MRNIVSVSVSKVNINDMIVCRFNKTLSNFYTFNKVLIRG